MSERNGRAVESVPRSTTRGTRASQAASELSVAAAVTFKEPRSYDPYNSSGGFDRKKHWERVGKR